MEETLSAMDETVSAESKWKNTLCRVYHGLNTFCGVHNERNTFSGVCKGRRNIFFVGCYGKKRFPQCRLSFYEESFLAREKQFLKE